VALSIDQNPRGPFWPLGNIIVVTPGTPVSIMSLVDPNGYNDPNTPTNPQSDEYARRAQQIFLGGFHLAPGGATGMVTNAGFVYIIKRGTGAGPGNRNDPGVIIAILLPGTTLFLASAPLNLNVLNPYDIYVDADNAGDGAQVSLVIQ
jgi:hypothetical protein